jgi:hypothetical protein
MLVNYPSIEGKKIPSVKLEKQKKYSRSRQFNNINGFGP